MHQFIQIFQNLPDPRASNARHDLTEVLLIALAAILCGAQRRCAARSSAGARARRCTWSISERFEAWLAIGEHLAPARNEVAGALEALKLLSLRGCVVTADALHCRAALTQALADQQADWALALKENQLVLMGRRGNAPD